MNWDATVGMGLLFIGFASSGILVWRDVREQRRRGGSAR